MTSLTGLVLTALVMLALTAGAICVEIVHKRLSKRRRGRKH